MSKLILALCLAASIAILGSVPASAQSEKGERTVVGSKSGDAVAPASEPVIARAEPDSTYDSRALRLESHWGNLQIVRGAEGPIVGRVGVFRTANVEKTVAGSARAESEARLFKASHRPGAIASAVGALTFGVGLVASSNSSNNAATPILVIGGIGTMLWGAQHLNAAYAALSRAIWWYNRDFAR